MARSRSTFGKMQREQEKRSRARAKQEKRLARRDEDQDEDQPEEGSVTTAEDQASILEALARLHEDLAEGRIPLEIFEARQEELRSSIRID
jgi:hypothetical protein